MADSEVIHLLDIGSAQYIDEKFNDNSHHNDLFIGSIIRKAIEEGKADYTPIFFSEIPLLMLRVRMHLDAALITVAPPDKNGYVIPGMSVDIKKTAAEIADCVIARCLLAGDSIL